MIRRAAPGHSGPERQHRQHAPHRRGRGRTAGVWIGGISVAFAALAYAPSFAAFHPAFFLTLAALPGAMLAGMLGAIRLSALAFCLVAANSVGMLFVTGGVDLGVRADRVIAALAAMVALFGAALLVQYRRTR